MTNTVDTLKNLTQLTYDSVQGYRKSAEKADSVALKRALETRAEKRQDTFNTLNYELVSRGEEPIASTSMSGTAHQVWLKITDAFSNGDENAVERVEEGEDYIAEQFRDELDTNNDLEPRVRSMIQTAYNEISAGERFADMLEQQYA